MSAIGALIGLALAIFLIIKKVSPLFSLMAGAVVGGLAGGMNLPDTVSTMLSGVNNVTPAIIRVLAAGILSGVLVVTGAAESIAVTIMKCFGQKQVYLTLAFSTMLLTAVGVFIDVAVITIAPVALHIAKTLKIPRATLLLMMIGGGKCGNIISPNPNTIIAAENFHAGLISVMYANIIPAIIGLVFTVYVVGKMMPKKEKESFQSSTADGIDETQKLPPFFASISGPAIAIALLALRPVLGINIDPMIALPAGGIAGILIMRKTKMISDGLNYGLSKMGSIAILLIGTGTIAGIIKASSIKDLILSGLENFGLNEVFVAPVSSMLMSAATASTTAGATIASASFAETIIAAGISGVWGAAMVNSGATVFDHLPHGSFFHATGGVVELDFAQRLKLIPYESLIGFVLAAGTTVVCML